MSKCLSHNRLKQLNSTIFNDLLNLTEIELSNNQIIKIDNLFDNNLKLKYLYLKRNKIKSVNFRLLSKLVNLNRLELDHNRIKDIDINEVNHLMCCAGNISLCALGNIPTRITPIDMFYSNNKCL